MRFEIVAVGRLKAGPEAELYARYAERFAALSRGLGLNGIKLTEISESLAKRDADRKVEEGRSIIAALDASAFIVALDEKGGPLSSESLAERIRRLREDGRKAIQFVIGGADGLDETVRKRADLILSFGAMTIPHQLVRMLLAEQLYRSCTILSGHPYHRS
jgi:23S rRNA (pseudouridine1915-N3)-methyltransferase